jgi:hypothetical protein
MSAAASLGLCLLWDTDFGLSHVDKYTYSSEEHIKVSVAPLRSMSHLIQNYHRRVPSSPQVSSTAASGPTLTPPSLCLKSTSKTPPCPSARAQSWASAWPTRGCTVKTSCRSSSHSSSRRVSAWSWRLWRRWRWALYMWGVEMGRLPVRYLRR